MGFFGNSSQPQYYQYSAEQEADKPDRDIKPGKFGKFCVVYSLAFCSAYTITAIFLHALTGTEPGTLTSCVFAFFGTELLTLGTVKVVKKINDRKGDQKKAKADTTAEPDGGRDGI